ncbi:hypothetical protein VXS72_15780 [Acinetobacter pittii]|uniref:hypothetical protein n=1 Tax=Acinetobacter pittii TaxID=48296 RepID=UPI002E1878F9|nr:hypothetical protein [Acinetobacter pittii]
MDKCREEFEKLEDVKDILEDHKNIFFDSKTNMYSAKKEISENSVSYPSWKVTYLNGAFYAFQHQLAKVEELQRRNQMLSDSTLEMGSKQIRDTDLINQQASTLFRLREFIYGSGDLREYSDEELLEHQRILKAIVTGEQALMGEG